MGSEKPLTVDHDPRVLSEQTLNDLFEAQTRRNPDAPALAWQDGRLTYSELNEKSNRLAHFLIRKGVGPEDLVALCISRSPEMIVSIIGILKAGAAYVPLDPNDPLKRLRFILDDVHPVCVIATVATRDRLPEVENLLIVDEFLEKPIDQDGDKQNPGERDRRCQLSEHHPAYVIFTSGSTGVPKGVVATHHNVKRLFSSTENWFRFGQNDVWSLFHSCAFDFSVWEMWGALLYGGKLVIVPHKTSRSPSEFMDLLRQFGVTMLSQTPSAFYQLIEAERANPSLRDGLTLRCVVLGGEALEFHRVASWRENHPISSLVNMYGITETTVHVTYLAIEEHNANAAVSLIGIPIPDLQVYVLDEKMKPVERGAVGELYVGGEGLARGYLSRPSLTAERFVPDPFGRRGARLYRTGDRVRDPGLGVLEYIGRTDQQVKIRGFRIELEEVAAAIRKQVDVEDAVVLLDGKAYDKRLAAYVIRKRSNEMTKNSQKAAIEDWQAVFESAYRNDDGIVPDDFDFIGWISSYTGNPIERSEMQEWVEETIKRISVHRPRSILEIGCGTGLLMTRLAPGCDRYIGIDFSQRVLDYVSSHITRTSALKHVELHRGVAHELEFLPNESVDMVILNSVVQYFPDVEYLQLVLRESIRVTRTDGHVFVGDVRSLPLLKAFHTSVQLQKAKRETTLSELRARVEYALKNEEELVLDVKLFLELHRHCSRLRRVESWPKSSLSDNELARFRYDVMLHIGELKETLRESERAIGWDADGHWKEELITFLRSGRRISVGVRGIRDLRVESAVEAARSLWSNDVTSNVAELKAATNRGNGEHPASVTEIAERLGVDMVWEGFAPGGTLDAIFNPQWEPLEMQLNTGPRITDFRVYANVPAHRTGNADFIRSLKLRLAETLPTHMLPATVNVLAEWPLTANGKLDRGSLPAPDRFSTREYHAPRTADQESLCRIFAQTLGVDRVGLTDDFFDLGGHSLLAIRLIARIRDELAADVTIANILGTPIVGDLTEILESARAAQKSRPELRRRAVFFRGGS
jgi:pristinamycin I synthase-3/4